MSDATGALSAKLERLYDRQSAGIKFGLETVQALLASMGNPERAFAAVHVAGTNGKGSVCAMLEAILRTSGLRTGIYTSPHLVRFNERIRVDGRCIGDAELAELFSEIERRDQDLAARPGGRANTFFEFTTALAFEYFHRREVPVAVVETGLGGRLDATNVVLPVLSVITPIGIEHTQYLGKDLASIATEKGGIIKPGRPVVCAGMEPEALAVLRRIAQEQGSRLVVADDAVSVRRLSQDARGQKVRIESAGADLGTVRLPLLGRHQLANCVTAIAAVEEFGAATGVTVPPDSIKAGLEHTVWPGRLQVLAEEPLTILDGGHNPSAAAALADALRELAGRRPLGLVVGMCTDKDAFGFLRAFSRNVKRCWCVPLRTERGMVPGNLARLAGGLGWKATEGALDVALQEAQEWARTNGGAVCIAGSLFLVGEVLERMPEANPFCA